MKIKNFDEWETAQTLPMRKRGSWHLQSNCKQKKLPKLLKKYSVRRREINNGNYNSKTLFGSVGCSTYWN